MCFLFFHFCPFLAWILNLKCIFCLFLHFCFFAKKKQKCNFFPKFWGAKGSMMKKGLGCTYSYKLQLFVPAACSPAGCTYFLLHHQANVRFFQGCKTKFLSFFNFVFNLYDLYRNSTSRFCSGINCISYMT